MAAVWVQLAVGTTFSSFEKLEAEVKAYQNEKFVQLVKRNTRKWLENKYQSELKVRMQLWFTILYITLVHLGVKVTKVRELDREGIKGGFVTIFC